MEYQPLLMIMFHTGQFRNIKHFSIYYISIHLRKEFLQTRLYNRFVKLQQEAMMPKAVLLKIFCLGTYTGKSFIDSTPLEVVIFDASIRIR